MAKRKRLGPAKEIHSDTDMPELETKSLGVARTVTRQRPPIAQVAGEASATAALQELASEVRAAKESGRMVLNLPEAQINASYLVRDRMMADEDELAALMQSLKARGQQTPIEVVELGPEQYGLISGWRRLTALRRLLSETGEARFGAVQALIRTPETAEDAYTAMVEENEIRVGLSYYERARVVAKSVEQGVFPDDRAALQTLFAAASRSKRSKIKSFLSLYQAADDLLTFPTAISERLGIAVAKALEDTPDRRMALRKRFVITSVETAQDEAALLQGFLQESDTQQSLNRPDLTKPATAPAAPPHREGPHRDCWSAVTEGIAIRRKGGAVEIKGAKVDDRLYEALVSWLQAKR